MPTISTLLGLCLVSLIPCGVGGGGKTLNTCSLFTIGLVNIFSCNK